MISSPRSEGSRPSTPTTSSSPTVPLASISSARACFRFFNSHLRGVYESCVLPTVTAFAASHSICSSMYSVSTAPACPWRQVTFHPPPSLNLQRTFSLSSPFSGLVFMGLAAVGDAGSMTGKKRRLDEATTTDSLLRAMHIRLRLRGFQRREVIKKIAIQRAAFNFAAERVSLAGESACFEKLRSDWNAWKKDIKRNAFGAAHKYRHIAESNMHTKIEAQGIRAYAHAVKAGREKAKKTNAPFCPVKFRSARKLQRETLLLEKGGTGGPLRRFLPVPYVERHGRGLCILQIGREEYYLMEDKVATIERLVQEKDPAYDGKIVWDKRVGSFHFVYTYALPRKPDRDPRFLDKNIVAMDPGVYPFQAFYSPTAGTFGRLLDGTSDQLICRCEKLDALQSRVDLHHGNRRKRTARQRYRTRKRLKRRLARERARFRGWVKAAHYDCAHRLLGDNVLALQPRLQTARLSRRATRCIRGRTVRQMMSWSHGKFVQRLKCTSARYSGCHVLEISEPGTSKTCTHCGFFKADLRVADKFFKCPRCAIVVDRQIAGARNNFLAAYGKAVGLGWDGVDG